LRDELRYDPNTGFWERLKSTKRRTIGPIRPTVVKGGYPGRWRVSRQISFRGKPYSASRLAWFYMTGKWPNHEIDHRDGDATNDRWDNLRKAERWQNQANTGVYKTNKLGLKGVHIQGSRYRVKIHKDGRAIHLGYYSRPDEAAQAYAAAAQTLYGEFARLK
jgi:hypothetical protein